MNFAKSMMLSLMNHWGRESQEIRKPTWHKLNRYERRALAKKKRRRQMARTSRRRNRS